MESPCGRKPDLALFSTLSIGSAQNLTPAQKEADFRYLASLFSVYYAPIEWKKQLFNFDALAIRPWLDRVARTTTDVDFYEVCVEYVASLNDTHDRFTLPSDFSATLGFTTDVYDGVLLIDALNRTLLPVGSYPFTIGDELSRLTGSMFNNSSRISQSTSPTGIRLQASDWRRRASPPGLSRACRMPRICLGSPPRWRSGGRAAPSKPTPFPGLPSGTPLEVGPVPSPKRLEARGPVLDPAEPGYMTELRQAQWSGILNAGEDGVNRLWSPQSDLCECAAGFNFTRRMGGLASDFYYSGTFRYEELTIGYIRIPNYSPPSTRPP